MRVVVAILGAHDRCDDELLASRRGVQLAPAPELTASLPGLDLVRF